MGNNIGSVIKKRYISPELVTCIISFLKPERYYRINKHYMALAFNLLDPDKVQYVYSKVMDKQGHILFMELFLSKYQTKRVPSIMEYMKLYYYKHYDKEMALKCIMEAARSNNALAKMIFKSELLELSNNKSIREYALALAIKYSDLDSFNRIVLHTKPKLEHLITILNLECMLPFLNKFVLEFQDPASLPKIILNMKDSLSKEQLRALRQSNINDNIKKDLYIAELEKTIEELRYNIIHKDEKIQELIENIRSLNYKLSKCIKPLGL